MSKSTEARNICLALGALSPGRERLMEQCLSQANPNTLTLPEKENPLRSHQMKKGKRMIRNSFKSLVMTSLTGLVLAACSSVEMPEAASSNVNEPRVYLLDGANYTPAEIEKLMTQHALYFAVTPEMATEGLVYAFRTAKELTSFKQQYKPNNNGLEAQFLNSNTTIYDGTDYKEDKLKLPKGTVINDLGSLLQPDGESWDNQISSLKAADGVWTNLFDYLNLNANPPAGTNPWQWATFGDNYKNLPDYVNNDTTSIEVEQ
jgi:hypothetical protein